jgi:hypothetical protein
LFELLTTDPRLYGTYSLDGTRVNDAGMKGLATLKQLRSLSLRSTEVSDIGLKELDIGRNGPRCMSVSPAGAAQNT